MTWTQNFDDTFARSNGAPGNGWVDQSGAGVWAISSNKLVGTTTDTSGFLGKGLQRQSSEAQISIHA